MAAGLPLFLKKPQRKRRPEVKAKPSRGRRA
jgi:hypothetical protein